MMQEAVHDELGRQNGVKERAEEIDCDTLAAYLIFFVIEREFCSDLFRRVRQYCDRSLKAAAEWICVHEAAVFVVADLAG